MTRVQRAFTLSGFAALGLLAASCAPTQVAINGRFPANFPQAAELRRITVAAFDGRGGSRMMAAIRAELTSATFDGQRHFAVLDDHGASTGDGAQGVLSGSASIDRSQQNFVEGRRECVARDKDNKCVRHREYNVSCSRLTIRVTASPVLTRLSDSSIVYSEQKSAERNERWCQDQQRRNTEDAMIDAAVASIATTIRRDIAPYNSVLNATIKESADGLPRPLATQFSGAVAAAKANNVTGACDMWRAVDAANPGHVWTTFNLGICAEATGDFPGALSRYQRSRELGGASDRAVSEAIARVNRLMGAEQQLVAEEAGRVEAAEAEARRVAEDARRLQAERDAAARRASAEAQRVEASRVARRAELSARHGAVMADAIASSQVLQGMTQQQVLESRGQPNRREEITPTDQIWHYGSERVMFSAGKVTFVRR